MSVDQVRPGGPISGWYPNVVVTLRVSGVPEGTFVESRLVIPGTSSIELMPTFVSPGGIINVGGGSAVDQGTLEAAKAEASRLRTATAEVRVTPTSPVLSVQITRWTRYEPLVLRDVKMKKTKAGATFTGRLVTESGKPIKKGTGVVVAQQFTPLPPVGTVSRGVIVRPNGTFTVSTTQRPQPGTIGVWGYLIVQRGAWVERGSSTYSRPFVYRP